MQIFDEYKLLTIYLIICHLSMYVYHLLKHGTWQCINILLKLGASCQSLWLVLVIIFEHLRRIWSKRGPITQVLLEKKVKLRGLEVAKIVLKIPFFFKNDLIPNLCTQPSQTSSRYCLFSPSLLRQTNVWNR